MSGESNGTLLRVAEAISDGIPIDWDTETASRPDLKDMLVELRKVETLAKVHGTAPDLSAIDSVLDEVAADAEETRYGELPNRVEEPTAPGIPTTWGPLRILEKIGEGGFGEVYRAFDPALQTEVALKLWRADQMAGREAEDFLAEARKLARVRHPNILTVHGAAEHDGRVGMWTDLLRGETLESLVARGGTFSAKEASAIGVDLCGALAAVHAAGLVHRDVKAANVMREQGGRIVLMDFGSGGELSSERVTLAGEPVFGTPITMAPEQFGAGSVGPSADIYSLGVLLFRLVTGRYPVEGATYEELLEKHEQGKRLHLRDLRADLPAEFVHVVERATAVVPEARFASAGAMEQGLVAVTGHVQVAPPPVPVPVPGPWWRRWVAPAAAAAAVIVIGVVAGPRIAEWIDGGGSEETIPDQGTISELVPEPPPVDHSKTAPPPSTATALTATAKLFRQSASGSEQLLPGARIAPGDRLFMRIESAERMYVYVLDEDEAGSAFFLFPANGLEKGNPIEPGMSHRLPGSQDNADYNWQVTTAGGAETILVIASRNPQPDIERDFEQLLEGGSEIGPVEYLEVPERTRVALRGIGGVVQEEPTVTAGSDRISDAFRNLTRESDELKDIWTWQIQLDNPSG